MCEKTKKTKKLKTKNKAKLCLLEPIQRMPPFWIGKFKFLPGLCFKIITWPYLTSLYTRYLLSIKKPIVKL